MKHINVLARAFIITFPYIAGFWILAAFYMAFFATDGYGAEVTLTPTDDGRVTIRDISRGPDCGFTTDNPKLIGPIVSLLDSDLENIPEFLNTVTGIIGTPPSATWLRWFFETLRTKCGLEGWST